MRWKKDWLSRLGGLAGSDDTTAVDIAEQSTEEKCEMPVMSMRGY